MALGGGVPLDSRDLNVTEIDGFLLDIKMSKAVWHPTPIRKYLGSTPRAPGCWLVANESLGPHSRFPSTKNEKKRHPGGVAACGVTYLVAKMVVTN